MAKGKLPELKLHLPGPSKASFWEGLGSRNPSKNQNVLLLLVAEPLKQDSFCQKRNQSPTFLGCPAHRRVVEALSAQASKLKVLSQRSQRNQRSQGLKVFFTHPRLMQQERFETCPKCLQIELEMLDFHGFA